LKLDFVIFANVWKQLCDGGLLRYLLSVYNIITFACLFTFMTTRIQLIRFNRARLRVWRLTSRPNAHGFAKITVPPTPSFRVIFGISTWCSATNFPREKPRFRGAGNHNYRKIEKHVRSLPNGFHRRVETIPLLLFSDDVSDVTRSIVSSSQRVCLTETRFPVHVRDGTADTTWSIDGRRESDRCCR